MSPLVHYHDLSSIVPSNVPLQLHASTSGTHKVKYTPDEDWDFHLDVAHKPIDLSLALPHYRARYQPVDHRMSMFVGSETAPIRVKVVRRGLTLPLLPITDGYSLCSAAIILNPSFT